MAGGSEYQRFPRQLGHSSRRSCNKQDKQIATKAAEELLGKGEKYYSESNFPMALDAFEVIQELVY